MWRCQYCETFNKDENTVCEVCGNSKGSQAGMPKAESQDSHVIMTQQPDAGFTGSGSAPVYGADTVPTYGSGSAPVPDSGSAPVYGSGSTPVHGSGSAPVYGSGSTPVHGSGSAPVYGTGAAPAAETAEPVNAKKRKKGAWAIWLIVILILLVIGGTVSWVMFEEEIRTFIADMTGNEAETDTEDDADVAGSGASIGSGLAGASTDETVPAFSGAQYVNAESSAEDIAYVQDILQKLGLLTAGGFTPGEYDAATSAAVRSFQQKVNADSGYVALSETGECDAATLVYFARYSANTTATMEPAATAASVPNTLSAGFSKDTAVVGESVELSATTDESAAALKLYDESGNEIGSWNAADASVVENGVRVWKIQKTFDTVGNYVFSVNATADNISYGSSYLASIKVVSLDVSAAGFDAATVMSGQNRIITATTPVDAMYLYMCDNTGNRICEWAANGNSVVEGANRVWTVECTFGIAGTYDYTFIASNDSVTVGSGITATITVYPVPPVIHTAAFGSVSAKNNSDVEIYAETETHAVALMLYNESGECIATWDADTYSAIENNVRVWHVYQQFSAPGNYALNLYATADNVNNSIAAPISISIFSLDVSSAYYDADTVIAGQNRTITATTPVEATYLYMCDWTGTRVREWAAEGNSVVDGANRIWTVVCNFTVIGTYDYTFFASNDTVTTGGGITAAITVSPVPPVVYSATFGSTYVQNNTDVSLYVETESHATGLLLYNVLGVYIGSWDADTYSVVENGVRVWNITMQFAEPGDYPLNFFATADDVNVGPPSPANISVFTLDVTSAYYDADSVVAGQNRTITATSPAGAMYLYMYDNNGNRVREWAAEGNSYVEGANRIWNVICNFTVVGTYDYTFVASNDGVTIGGGVAATITVLPPPPSVHSASFNKTIGLQQEELLITATTDPLASSLFLYNENNEFVNGWDAATYSYEENGVRIWNVTQGFGYLGDRYLTLRAAAVGEDPGNAYAIAVTIINVDVSYVEFDATTVVAGQPHVITAHTPVDAQYLFMYNIDGVQVRAWDALSFSVVDEELGIRIWSVPITFTVVGTYDYAIHASYDSLAVGLGIPTTITVLSN